ncbi:MAG: preprotein translocase subunit YajC [Alphaproteobacteria bacterium]
MLISKAYAQTVEPVVSVGADVENLAGAGLPAAPSAMEAFMWNMGLVAVLVLMFYVLLIRPQQKRMKEHTQMLQGLKKGDKVVTAGGLIGTIAKIKDGDDEVEVDLGDRVSVKVVRSMLQARNNNDPLFRNKPANDGKK